MKTLILSAALTLFTVSACFAQLSVGYHQSGLPFASISYEIKGRLVPELRLSTDTYLGESFSPEFVLTYQFLNKEDYEFYSGLGFRANDFQGVVLPIGFNFFPFEQKKFGFHLELAPIINDNPILRGSWGIRYRFLRE